jgi:hypothetical protein
MGEAAPGSNGLTIGFFPYFGKYYVGMVNHSEILPDVFKESIIKLIPKNKKKCFLVSVDQSKAFDSISHLYLFNCSNTLI